MKVVKKDGRLQELDQDKIEVKATLPQADDLKVQPVIPSEAGAEKADAVRAAAQQKIIRPESLPKPELNSNFSPMQAPAGKK